MNEMKQKKPSYEMELEQLESKKLVQIYFNWKPTYNLISVLLLHHSTNALFREAVSLS